MPLSSRATPTSFPVPLPSAMAQIHAFSPSVVVRLATSMDRLLVVVLVTALAGDTKTWLVLSKVLCLLLTEADEDAELMPL